MHILAPHLPQEIAQEGDAAGAEAFRRQGDVGHLAEVEAAEVVAEAAEGEQHQGAVEEDDGQRPDAAMGLAAVLVGIGEVDGAFVPAGLPQQGEGGGSLRAFFKAVGLLDGVDGLALDAFGQGGSYFGQRCLGGTGQGGVTGEANLGETEDEGFDLQPGEHLRWQGGVFGEGVADARCAVDQGAAGAQGVDVTVEGAGGDAGFCRQTGGGDRLRQHPDRLQQAKQAVGAGHGMLTVSDRKGGA